MLSTYGWKMFGLSVWRCVTADFGRPQSHSSAKITNSHKSYTIASYIKRRAIGRPFSVSRSRGGKTRRGARGTKRYAFWRVKIAIFRLSAQFSTIAGGFCGAGVMATPARGAGLSIGIKLGACPLHPWPWGASNPRKSRKTRKNDGFWEVLYGKVANFAKIFSPPDSPRPSAFFVRSMSAAFLKGGGATRGQTKIFPR